MIFNKFPVEAIIWLAALGILAAINPDPGHLFTLCPLKIVGFEHCPGCGLGTAVSQALHGQLKASFHTHPLGLFAIIVLSYRSIYLLYLHKKT